MYDQAGARVRQRSISPKGVRPSLFAPLPESRSQFQGLRHVGNDKGVRCITLNAARAASFCSFTASAEAGGRGLRFSRRSPQSEP